MIRIDRNINPYWKFEYGDIEQANHIDFDDSQWYDVGLPHSFGIPYFMENDFYVGYGCYRKWLEIEPNWIGKKLFLEFQGVFQVAEIFINGFYVESHRGGYTAFCIDITDFVHEGKNLLMARVNNFWDGTLAPRAGEHVFNGGIYRDVTLLVREKNRVDWYGVWVSTPTVNHEKASLLLQTELRCDEHFPTEVTLLSEVYFQGEKLLELKSECNIEAYGSIIIKQEDVIQTPNLWSSEHPQQYQLLTSLYIDGKKTDCCETNFGIRWFSFDAQQGFFLNGQHCELLGANVHQDHAGWSDAVTHSGIARDIHMIKECGMNLIRGSHYPHHTFFAEECDRQGILFWSELCYWGIGGSQGDGYWNASGYPILEEERADFEESCMLTLEEMIRVNRNHPSIITWSMGNEVFFSNEEVIENAKILTRRLVERTHELDPFRPAAVGGAQRKGFDQLGDLAGYNGDGAVLYSNPGFPNMVSEYGSRISDRPGELSPCFTDGVGENLPWRSGKALWCGFHHGSIIADMGHMGMIDYFRLPLLTWYWYRRELLGIEPPSPHRCAPPTKLVLKADKTIICCDGTDDTQLIICAVDLDNEIVSAELSITLSVTQGGGYFPTGRDITLSRENGGFLDGMGAIEFRSYFECINRITANAAGLPIAEIVITSKGGATWDNRFLKLQTSPPTKFCAKLLQTQQTINLAANKPTFCSSFSIGYAPSNATSQDNSSWLAASDADGEWIVVDLEGNRIIGLVQIKLCETVDFEIYISSDSINYELLEKAKSRDYKISLSNTAFRYFRLFFPSKPSQVKHILLYS